MSPLIRWQDAVDIIIMSFLVYQLYRWFKNTKAFQVVIGLGSLAVVYLITKNLGFFMTSWILQELGTVVFILIIVIFQAEIRQALYRISPLRSIFGRKETGPYFDMEEFTSAVFSLAASRTGAIIVFQRTEPLQEYLSNGMPIDSTVSGQLLECIFHESSPLHDGALVILNDRISHVCCHLPLSTNNEIPQFYGTRHRAGLGLTEHSDAVVVIVSEERGEVSLAISGKLQRLEIPEQLSVQLAQLLSFPDRRVAHVPFVKRLFMNFKTKLAIAALVSVSWLIITARQGEIVTLMAPVQFRNLPESQVLRKSAADEVELQLKTISSLIPLPREGDIVAELDLSKVRDGDNQIMVRKEDIKLPSGVSITRVKPASIRVTVEKKLKKLVRVEARVTGSPGGGKRLKKIRVVPSVVMIEGPESALSHIDAVRTEELSLSAVDRNTTFDRRIDLPAQIRPLYDDMVKITVLLGG
jgi:diadenylate cyclase